MRSAQYHSTVQYVLQRVDQRHQCNLGVEFCQTFSTELRDVEKDCKVESTMSFALWGMASVSWLYLFNIQVRANCTTACNIQAALQYVELTHESSSVSLLFLYLFRRTKKEKKKTISPKKQNETKSKRKKKQETNICACSLERVPKSCWAPSPGGRGP